MVELDELYKTSKLPDTTDIKTIEKILIVMQKEFYGIDFTE